MAEFNHNARIRQMDTPLFTLTNLSPADMTHPRGKTTWEFKMPGGMQLTTYFRQRGTTSGMHFHKGEDPSKNPEYIIVLIGMVYFFTKDREGKTKSELVNVRIGENPTVIEVRPGIFHWMEYISDTLYAEPRITHFDPAHPDTFGEDEWVNFIRE